MIRIIPAAPAPCWALRVDGEDYERGDGVPHFADRGEAERAAAEVGAGLAPYRRAEACWRLACDCWGDDGEHYTRGMAEEAARGACRCG